MAISMISNSLTNYLIIKVNSSDIRNTIDFITKTCQVIEPSFPVEYEFLNDKYNQMLSSETNMKKSLGIFSVFTIVVLCLGLLGMVMFRTDQKIKEIGIRRCLGEKPFSIIGHLTKSFFFSGIIAGIIAVPLTWYLMDRWLQNYAYRTKLNVWVFFLSGIIIIGLALISVSWQSWKAATRNPVEALRYE